MDGLKDDSEPGSDGVQHKVFKECSTSLASPLWNIARASVDLGAVSIDWRSAAVTHIYKGDQKYDSLNYQPVSLTTVACKVMEKIV